MGRLAALRHLAQRFAFLMLVAASFLLMILGKADIVLVERIRTLVIDATAPILDALSRPAATVADVVDHIRELTALRAENARLKAENQRLAHWQTLARQLSSENAVLHQQLNFIPDPDPAFITARVIGDMGAAFGQSMLLNAGSRDGVRKGQAVLSGETLVGTIADVGDRSSRLLLLTDNSSHLPIMIESTRTRAILMGDNKSRPKLALLPGASTVQVGDRVVTSSSGAAFPPGLPVGMVVGTENGFVRVEPFVRRHELEYVAIVDFGLGGILPFPERPPVPLSPRRRGGGDN